MWGAGVRRAGPSTGAFFVNLTPLFAALLSSSFLGESPHGYHALAFALIVGGIVAAGHSDSHRASGESVAISTNVQSCHAATMKLNAAKLVYVRSVRFRSSTDVPMARMTMAASSAETAWTFTRAW